MIKRWTGRQQDAINTFSVILSIGTLGQLAQLSLQALMERQEGGYRPQMGREGHNVLESRH